MTCMPYRYEIEIRDREGSQLIGRAPIIVDPEPAVAHAHLQAMCVEELPPTTSAPPADVEPIFHARLGRPRIEGLRIDLAPEAGRRFGADLDIAYFRGHAQAVSNDFVEQKLLEVGQRFRFAVNAYPEQAGPERRSSLASEPIVQPLPIDEDRALDDYLARSVLVGGEEDGEDAPLPVFVPFNLLVEARRLARDAGPVETGGFLLGRLHRDAARRQRLFVVLTRLIPARHTRQAPARLAFTTETWAAARAATGQCADARVLGWFHHHPAEAAQGGVYFSAMDVAVQRTCFCRAYEVALLLSDRPAGMVPAFFGWHRGLVGIRGFHVMNAEPRR